jgi:riboflavin transporter FmnP
MSFCTGSFDLNEEMWEFAKLFTLYLVAVLSEINLGLLELIAGLLSIPCGFTINLSRIPHELTCLVLGFYEHGLVR